MLGATSTESQIDVKVLSYAESKADPGGERTRGVRVNDPTGIVKSDPGALVANDRIHMEPGVLLTLRGVGHETAD